jgi:hypothetical protein
MMMFFRPVQPENKPLDIVSTPLGIETEVKLAQSLKDSLPIDVTLSGMSIEVRPEPSKAPLPIVFKLLGRLMDFSLVHPLNADIPISTKVVGGSGIVVRFVQPSKAEVPM